MSDIKCLTQDCARGRTRYVSYPGIYSRIVVPRIFAPSWQNQNSRKFMSIAKSRKFHASTDYLQPICVDLCWVAKRRKTCVDLCANLCSIEISASPRKYSQIDASRRKWVAKRNTRVRLARALRRSWLYSFIFPFGRQ